MKLISRTTLLIALNAVVLLGGGLVSYVIISHQVDASIPPPKSGKTVQSAVLGVASIEDDTILSKPIFRRSRQAIGFDSADADSEAKDQPPPAPPPPVLVGVLRGTGGQSWVLLEGGGGASRSLLAQGSDFEGWRVLRIGAKDVILRHKETNINISVRLPYATNDTSINTK